MRMIVRCPRAHTLKLFDADEDAFNSGIIGEVWCMRVGHGGAFPIYIVMRGVNGGFAAR